MVRRLKKYAKLLGLMYINGVRQSDICEHLGKSASWATNRFAGDGCFTIDEGYAILDFFELPHSEFTTYFPPGGFAS